MHDAAGFFEVAVHAALGGGQVFGQAFVLVPGGGQHIVAAFAVFLGGVDPGEEVLCIFNAGASVFFFQLDAHHAAAVGVFLALVRDEVAQ